MSSLKSFLISRCELVKAVANLFLMGRTRHGARERVGSKWTCYGAKPP